MEKNSRYKFLYNIDLPSDLRKLDLKVLPQVCDEVRDYLIDVVTRIGGHFGAGLGIVELTVALHYVYNTPKDKIILDTGHQGYPHKILTGRRDLLPTIRSKGGISGFLKRSESEYDVFGAGHASTSISSALGIATARDVLKEDYRVAAVIGDGAMTGGMAFEAMNNCGVQKRDITVILNDNNMSIDNNVSALSNYFNELYASNALNRLRENIWQITGKLDNLGDRLRKVASRFEDSIKAIVTPGVLFEAMGFNYFGPLNGHNVIQLVRILRQVKDIHGPVLVHILTQKGKGYGPAESDERHFHAIDKINKATGKSDSAGQGIVKPPNYYRIFGKALTELARKNPRIVAITAAMSEGTGLDDFGKEFPGRLFDVGIAEAHAVTFAAGMATRGLLPVCCIYSTFLQRAFDQICHDVALQKLHVVFAIDRAGIVGKDGATHHGLLDLSYLRIVQNMTLMAPKDEQELRDMLYSAIYNYTWGPVAIRYPRGSGMQAEISEMKSIPYGKGEILRYGSDIAIIAVGKMVPESLKAADLLDTEGISAEVINARFIKPLDTELLDYLALKFTKIITVEDGIASGGFGSAVLEYIGTKHSNGISFGIHAIPDKIVEHGTQSELLHDLFLDAEGICRKVKEFLGIENYSILAFKEVIS